MFKAENIKPMPGYLLVRPDQRDDQTESGIFVVTDKKNKLNVAVVLASAIDGVEPLQKVAHKKWGGNEIEVGNEKLLLIHSDDIMAVIEI